MAIATDIPGLEVTIEVDGNALPEYDHGSADDYEAVSSVKYVEAQSSAEFAIRYVVRPPFTPSSLVQMDVVLDENYVQAPFCEWGGKEGCEGYLCSKSSLKIDGQDFTRNFRFSELKTEETNTPITKGLQQRLAPIGRIVLYFYFVEDLETVRPTEVGQLAFDDIGVLSEKALQKASSTSGDVRTHQTSFTAPEQLGGVTYSQVKTAQNEPFASFVFYYRSTAALKALGIIPRTPIPSPEPESETEERDPNDMTEEEMRAELRRMRDQRQELSRVKRERRDSEATLIGDDEVTWLGTQPSESQLKKVCRRPGADDEVVVLED